MAFKAVVFDFDLTLADSSAAVVECTNHALHSLGFSRIDPEAIKRTIGMTLPLAFRQLKGSEDPDLAQDFSRRFVKRADEVMVAWTEIYPNVAATLAALRRTGLKLAIVSTKFRYRIEAILAGNGLIGAIDVIVGAEDVHHHKPDPEGLSRVLALLRVQASEAVYVGDHAIDAQLASAAGTAFIAVRTGVSRDSSWGQWMPLAIVDDVGALAPLLDG